MEKYARVLVIIFFLILINLGLSVFIMNKLNKPVETPKPSISAVKSSPTPSNQASNPPSIQSDLNLIKAEIRALREALDITGLLKPTETP